MFLIKNLIQVWKFLLVHFNMKKDKVEKDKLIQEFWDVSLQILRFLGGE